MKTIKKVELRARRIRVSEAHEPYLSTIRSPEDVAKLATKLLGEEDQEVFIVLLLDIKNRVLGYNEVARGAIDACPVDIRQVFRAGIMGGASAVIVVHCHPSGDPKPSQDDIDLTCRLVDAGSLLQLPVLDHVIVTHDKMSSLAEMGLIEKK